MAILIAKLNCTSTTNYYIIMQKSDMNFIIHVYTKYFRDYFFSYLTDFRYFLRKKISKHCKTWSEQVKNGLFSRGYRWFQLFSVILLLNQNHPWYLQNSIYTMYIQVPLWYKILFTWRLIYLYRWVRVLKKIVTNI